MKLLIIGANGQLGRACAELFKDGGEFTFDCADLPKIDITRLDSVLGYMEKSQPDAIINCAAYTRVDAAESDAELCRKINALGPANLAQACSGTSVRLIHISTDYVFDGRKPLFEGYVEDDMPAPVSVYGKTKLEGEKPVLDYEFGSVLRTAWLYGTYGANFLKTMFSLSLRGGDAPLRVVSDQFGSPTSAPSLALQIREVLRSGATGLYHATSQGYCSWHEFAVAFFQEAGIDRKVDPISTAEYPTAAARPRNSILENRNLETAQIDVMPHWRKELGAFVKSSLETWRSELQRDNK